MPSPAEAGPARPLTAGVHADLDRGGAAHHEPAPGAGPVEELLHRRVARQFEHAPRRAERVESPPAEAETLVMDGLPDGGEIQAGAGDAVARTCRGCGTDLDLAARLGGEHAPAGKGTGGAQPGHGGGGALLVYRQGRVAAVEDQPLQFHPDPPRWPGLEADPVHMRFRVALGQRFLAVLAVLAHPGGRPVDARLAGPAGCPRPGRPAGPAQKWVVTLRDR